MKFEDEVNVRTNDEHLWELVSDPEVLVNCVPGAKEVQKVSETKYTGVVERGLTGITVSLDGEVELTKLNPPETLEAVISGEDGRTNSRMDAEAMMTMTKVGPDETNLSYSVDLDFTGRLASMGARILKRKVNSDINTFFENIKEQAEETRQSEV